MHEEEVTIVQVRDAAVDHIEEVDDEGEEELAEARHWNLGDAATRRARSASRPESVRIVRHAALSEEGSRSPPPDDQPRLFDAPLSLSSLRPPPISLLRRLVSRASRPSPPNRSARFLSQSASGGEVI